VAGHLTEFKVKLVDVLDSDSTLTALLASASAIYYRNPRGTVTYPALFYTVSTAYRPDTHSEGVRKMTVTFTAVGDDPDVLDQIETALEALLDGVGSTLSSANWGCKRCRIISSEPEDVDRFDPDTMEKLNINRVTFEVTLYAA